MKIESNGVTLHVAVDGPAGAPSVTFLTGIANDHTLWDAQVPALANEYRVIRIDSRGHGLSTSSPPPYTLATLVDDVLAVWNKKGVERSCLVGLGLGGIVAAEVALAHPERVSKLVPVSCRAQMTPQYAAIWPPLVEAAVKGGVVAISEMTIERWFAEPFRATNPKIIHHVRQAILRTSLNGYRGCIAAIQTLGFADRLSQFKMPVMYVSGELDQVGAPPAVMQAMCDATPGARHVVLPGATHISTICNPLAFNTALRDFLRDG